MEGNRRIKPASRLVLRRNRWLVIAIYGNKTDHEARISMERKEVLTDILPEVRRTWVPDDRF